MEVVGQSAGLAVRGSRPFTGLAESMTCLASELVVLEERFRWAVRIPGNPTHHGVGIQNQTFFTLQTLGGLWTLTACTGLVTFYGHSTAHALNTHTLENFILIHCLFVMVQIAPSSGY